jgi:sugar phosphate isomerase/epimerase
MGVSREAAGRKSAGRAPGEGADDWEAVMGALREARYNDPISLPQECKVPDMVRALRKDIAFLGSAVEQA